MADEKLEVIIKEGDKFYSKKELNIDILVSEQEAIIKSLQEQIDKANERILELRGKK